MQSSVNRQNGINREVTNSELPSKINDYYSTKAMADQTVDDYMESWQCRNSQ